MTVKNTCVYLGQPLADYGFKDGHPFGPQRHDVFKAEVIRQGLDKSLDIQEPVRATPDLIELFHTSDYIEKVRDYSKFGTGYLDGGDTPSFVGMYEAASNVAGSVTDAIDRIMSIPGLSDEDRIKILGGTAAKLLGIEE